ncbi:MAG: molybdate ABC transporter substrate-binding protein [Dehalococcoidia bacterium]|nr:molybdate ABC transporter substrate-binding protein [Dehalococcoidia bacterium]
MAMIRVALSALGAMWVVACASASIAAPAPSAPPLSGASHLSGELIVFAASSLTDVFADVGRRFERAHPGTRVVFAHANSAQLRTQLEQGARADLYVAANEEQMDAAVRQRVVVAESVRIIARNRLTVIVPRDNPARIERLQDLARPGIKLLLAQRESPAGSLARQSLARMAEDPTFGGDFADRALRNVVSDEPTVRHVATKTFLGEADAGVVFTTDVTAQIAAGVRVIPIPDQFNVINRYLAARVADGRNVAAAEAFVAYLLSPDGQAVLRSHGFLAP